MVCNWGPGQIGCGNSYYRSLGYQIGRVERLRRRWIGSYRHACSCRPGRRFRMGVGYQHGGGEQAGMRKQWHVL